MEMAADRIFSEMKESTAYLGLFEDLKNRKVDPFSAAELLIKGLEYNHKLVRFAHNWNDGTME
jgi:hypothetical protein